MRKARKEDMLLPSKEKQPKTTRHGLPVLLSKLRLHVEALSAPGVWGGYSAPNYQGTESPPSPPATGFPFHTQAAGSVWQLIQQIAKQQPDWSIDNLIRAAIEKSNVKTFEMTPEDVRLLELATNWLITGRLANRAAPAQTQIQVTANGGLPGDPFARKG